MPFTIRPAAAEDAEALAALIREIGLFERIKNEPPADTVAHVRAELALCLADTSHSLFVCQEETGLLLGYVSAHWLPYLIHSGPEGYVSELFVRGSARGQGVGSALLARITAEGRARGCERMMLINMRHRESYQREFYKKHGWEERDLAANFVLNLE